MTRTIQIAAYELPSTASIASNDARPDDAATKAAAKQARRAAALEGARAAATALATGATDTGLGSFDLPPALAFSSRLLAAGAGEAQSSARLRGRRQPAACVVFRLRDDDGAEVVLERTRLAAIAREFRHRPCFVYVDADGFHVRWNGGRGGLNLRPLTLSRAERRAARVTLVCFPTTIAAQARAAS